MTEALEAADWIAMASNDLGAARSLMATSDEYAAKVGFFCQQCAERSLKAVLVHRTGKLPPRTHDLEELARLAAEAGASQVRELPDLASLVPFASELRYAAPAETNAARMAEALQLAEVTLDWARKEVA